MGEYMNFKNSQENSAIHTWLNRQYGKPKHCEVCGTTDLERTYDWANLKNHQYRRLREDFKRMCRGCHRKFDKVIPPSQKGVERSEHFIEVQSKRAISRRREHGRFTA